MKLAKDWSPSAVLDRLANAAKDDEAVAAHIVLNERIPSSALASTTEASLIEAARHLGIDAGEVHVTRANELSQSVSVTAPVPVLRRIMEQDTFTQIMPGNLARDDVIIAPVWNGGIVE